MEDGKRMIYTVTFNPSLDYVVSIDEFKAGAVNRTQDERIYPGGKGINVSVVLKNLGIDNVALGFTAGFTGNHLIQLLEETGIQQDFIHVDEGFTRINVKIRSKSESEINGQGPKITKKNIDQLYEKLGQLKNNDILVLAGSIPAIMPDSMYMDIMEFLSGKNIRICVDATRQLLVNVLPYHPFLIKPNHHELGEIFNVTIHSKAEVITYAKRLQEMGAVNVLVSMSGEGAVLVSEDGNVYEANAAKGIVKYCVGSGDSMVAGFIAGYISTSDYKEAFKMGLCCGSATAFSETLATKEEIMALRSSYGERIS
jgi:1-phosphofructokinase